MMQAFTWRAAAFGYVALICAACAQPIGAVDLVGADGLTISTLLKSEPAFERMEGDHAVRRYDLGTCALLVTFDAQADRATAVAATDAAGPVDTEACLAGAL